MNIYHKLIIFFLVQVGLYYYPVYLNAIPDDSVGTTGFNYLKILPDARAHGLAGAYSPVTDGASSVFWQPAGITSTKFGISLTYHRWIADTTEGTVSFAVRLPYLGSLGLGYGFINVPGLEYRETVADVPDQFTAGSNLYIVSYAIPISFVSVGASVKIVKETIGLDKPYANFSQSAMVYDVGVRLNHLGNFLNLSLLGQNIGNFSAGTNIPAVYKVGVSFSLADTLLLVSDLEFPTDNKLNVHTGIELSIAQIMRLRLGYKTNTERLGGLSGFTIGLGLSAGPVTIDFSWFPQGWFGDTFRTTLNLAWK